MKKQLLLLILIMAVAFYLRANSLTSVPPSLDWDEVATGYNAYSIAQTGRDEYGHRLPVLFESFNDFKMPGYIYSLVPFVKIFGLNDFVVRLPSVIFGTIAVFVAFLLARKLSGNFSVGLITAAFLAISPWHLQFSRVAFEPAPTVLFFPLGIYLFLKGVEDKRFLPFSVMSFVISFYFYYSVRIVVPLVVFALVIIYRRQLLESGRTFLFSAVLGAVLLLPLLSTFANPKYSARLGVVSVFTDTSIGIAAAESNLASGNTAFSRIVNHRYLAYGKVIAASYLKHFSPQFLFASGDPNPRHGVRGMGELFWIDLPFLVLGLLVVWRMKNPVKWVLATWALAAPLPAAFSLPVPHALRTITLLPLPQIVVALGGFYAWQQFGQKKKFIFLGTVTVTYLILFGYYLNNYYGKYPVQSATDWAYQYKSLQAYTIKNEQKYQSIWITGEYWKPYIFYLYYNKFDPSVFASSVNHAQIGKFYFDATSWDSDKYWQPRASFGQIVSRQRVLVILAPDEVGRVSALPNVQKVTELIGANKVMFSVWQTL